MMPIKDPEKRRARVNERYAKDADHRAKILAGNRAWAAAHPEKVAEIRKKSNEKHRLKRNAACSARNKARPEKGRLARRKSLGIIGATAEKPVGLCPVCARGPQPLVCDHDHETGRIRGWICRHCNMALGQIGDSLQAARALVAYLETPL